MSWDENVKNEYEHYLMEYLYASIFYDGNKIYFGEKIGFEFASENYAVINHPGIIMIAKEEIADSFFNDYVVFKKKGQFPKRNDNWFPLFQNLAYSCPDPDQK
ncbi:hypothetical protein [uncultured Vagococcus sp.]|uniref:hypothetical protein n=1 Tax=uncultured Vagococcus sp. TaxID=189676 RepID=UPI0028D3F3AC|nr:hypothetical protein [uncultured Vagococcus sp.]